MRIPILISAAAIALALTPATFAATMTSSQTCSALESQFDQAATQKPKAAKMADAKALRSEGGKLCAGATPGNGVAYLQSALKYIGETPRS